MSTSSAESRGFFSYYREYARSGVHAASAAALTAFGLLASYTGNRAFILLAIAVYVLPPAFLYLTGEGERVPSIVGDEGRESRDADDRERDRERSSPDAERSATAASSDSRESTKPQEPTESAESTDASKNRDVSEVTRPTEPTTEDDPGGGDVTGDPPSAAAKSGTDRDGGENDETSAPIEADTDTDVDTDSDTDSDADPGAGSGESPGETGTLADDIGASDAAGSGDDGWTTVESSTDEPLTGVVATHDGAFAVGESGVVLARGADGWELALEDGPSADGQSLRSIDATADGRMVWFAGDGGVLGRYDVEEGRLTDHSAPKDQTSTWTAIAVVGPAGEERVYLANGSGAILRGTYDGGTVDWGEMRKPGSGSSITDLAFAPDVGYACDTSQGVYATTDGGESYETIGIEDANTDFAALAATDAELVVAGGDGTVFRYDGSIWTTLRAGETPLRAIDLTNERGLAAGDAGGIFERVDDGWTSVETPTDADLRGIVVGATGQNCPAVAVGTSGTIVEHDPN